MLKASYAYDESYINNSYVFYVLIAKRANKEIK